MNESSESEEFETPYFRIRDIDAVKRSRQLSPMHIFHPIPRTDSFNSLKLSVDSDSLRDGGAGESKFLSDDDTEGEETEGIDRELVKSEMEKLYKEIPMYVYEMMDKMVNGENQLVVDVMDKVHFIPLSAVLQTYSAKKALIVVPSSKIAYWIRGFLINSSAICPQGKRERQKVIQSMASSRTQVLFCTADRISSLNVNNFHYAFFVKAELCSWVFSYFSNFQGSMVILQSPGFVIKYPFKYETTVNPNLRMLCQPVGIFEPNYIEKLASDIDIDEKTCIIAPFKTTVDSIYKSMKTRVIRYENNMTNDEPRAIISTTALFYSTLKFDHYIFVDFPPSLSYLLMACYLCKKVSVYVNIPIANKLKSLSHSRSMDSIITQKILLSLFWNENIFRKINEVSSFSISGLDLSNDALHELINELIFRKYIQLIPFSYQNLKIRILSLSNDNSPILQYILKERSNSKGSYNLSLLKLSNSLNLSPNEIDAQLYQLSLSKTLEYDYSGESYFFYIKHEFTDDDEFMEFTREIISELSKIEEERDVQYDIMFSLLKSPDLIDEVIHERDIQSHESFTSIPTTQINREEIKKLLTNYRKVEWTPRAVARVLHGISSTTFTVQEWSHTHFWGSQSMSSFKDIMQLCQSVTCNPNKL